jgi:3-hydroxyacyl-CoA dehydrogenase
MSSSAILPKNHVMTLSTTSNRTSRPISRSPKAVEDFQSAVKDSWLVFEAVPEILGLKENTFLDLEKYTPQDCILASNSSSYKCSELLGKVTDATKTRVLNTHYMMPPQVRLSLWLISWLH